MVKGLQGWWVAVCRWRPLLPDGGRMAQMRGGLRPPVCCTAPPCPTRRGAGTSALSLLVPVGASGGMTEMFWFAPKGPHPLRDTRGMGHGLQSEEMMCTDDWKCCVARGGGESLEPAGPSQTTYAACGKGPFHMLSYIRLLLVHISAFLRCWPVVSSSTAHPCNEESGLQTPVVIIIVWTSRRWRTQEMEGPDA